MAILLGIDFETTGLDPATDRIIEIGTVMWDTHSNTMIQGASRLFHQEQIPQEIQDLTGISDTLMKSCWLREYSSTFGQIALLEKIDYFVAHNAAFERAFMFAPAIMDGLVGYEKKSLNSIPWIDTKTDIPYRPGKGQGSLSEIAMAHGVFNPMPHRALPDAMAMMQVLAQYDFAEVERYANTPTKTLVIRVPYRDGEEARTRVKALGYYWNPTGKNWTRNFKEFQVAEAMEAAAEAGFKAYLMETNTDENPFGSSGEADSLGVQADNQRTEEPALPL